MTARASRVGLGWLVAHEVRLGWRAMFANKKSRWIVIGLSVFGVGLLGLGGWGIASLLGMLAPKFDKGPVAFAALGGLFVFTLMLAQAVGGVMRAFYTRGDLDLLLASPAPPQAIVTARLLGVLIRLAPFYGGIAFATAIAGAIGGDWRWLSWPLSIVGLGMIAASLAVFAALALFRAFGPRRARTLMQVLAAIIGAAVFLVFQINNITNDGEQQRGWAMLAGQIDRLNFDPHHWALFAARGLLGDLVGATITALIGAIGFALTCAWMGRRFSADAAAIAGLSDPRRPKAARPVAPFRSGVMGNLIFKEWRLIRREPALLSQVLLQIIYFVPLLFIVGRQVLQGDGGAALTGAVGAGVFAVIAASLAGSLTLITVSAEDAPDLLTAAPINPDRARRAKIIAAVAPVLIAMLAPFALLATQRPIDALLAYAFCVGGCISASLIGVRFNQPIQRSQFNRQRGKNGSFAGVFAHSFVGGAWTSAASLAGAGLWPLALIPAFIGAGLLAAVTEEPKPGAVKQKRKSKAKRDEVQLAKAA